MGVPGGSFILRGRGNATEGALNSGSRRNSDVQNKEEEVTT